MLRKGRNRPLWQAVLGDAELGGERVTLGNPPSEGTNRRLEAMKEWTLSDAVFELGRLSGDGSICNHELLRRMARIAATYTGIEITGLGVFEHGLGRPATACHIVGPWAEGGDEAEGSDQLVGGDRVLAMRLVNLEPNRVYTRSEVLPDEVGERGIDGLSEAERTAEAVARFCRSDGAELVLGLRAVTPAGPLPAAALDRAREIGPYIAECWAAGWKSEPVWVGALKPSARRVLQLVLDGLDDDQIADETGLTYHSVRAHLKRLFKEAGVRSRLHLMQAYRTGASVVEADRLLAAV